ncbi:MAG: PilT/PilU family type 4a pilus ATPase, partial [Lentisphaerae bacterium]
KHIITIEDPIEFVHSDIRSLITQREVGNDTNDFHTALRHVVRQSPDVIFIGEIRDYESVSMALSAAMTGHLVVTTMHTVDPLQTLERIINYYPEDVRDQMAEDLGMSLVGIGSQRLLPRKDGNGLYPVFEILRGTPVVQDAIRKRELDLIPDIIRAGKEEGMITFAQSLANAVRNGIIERKVAENAATYVEEFNLALEGMRTGIDTLRDRNSSSSSRESGKEGPQRMQMKQLLKAAIKWKASDLLLTVDAPPLLRVDGELHELNLPALNAFDVKQLVFSILSAPQRIRLEREKEIDLALSIEQTNIEQQSSEKTDSLKDHRFRVNAFYQKGHLAAALRVIPQTIPNPDELMIPSVIMDLANLRSGLVLVTGPTGQGKSTTLACLIDRINQTRPCHIITVEDPIEYVHTNKAAIIEQRELYADTHSYANALKYVLRQDPDVILISEMRDPETIAAALTAAETGHLVFSTLHTNNCPQTVDRIVDVFPPNQQSQIRVQLAGALSAVIAQRLLPHISGEGRVPLFEIMKATTGIRALIRDGKTHLLATSMETGSKDGMITMEKALEELLRKGLISRETYETYRTPH